jgi:hypothetical protein
LVCNGSVETNRQRWRKRSGASGACSGPARPYSSAAGRYRSGQMRTCRFIRCYWWSEPLSIAKNAVCIISWRRAIGGQRIDRQLIVVVKLCRIREKRLHRPGSPDAAGAPPRRCCVPERCDWLLNRQIAGCGDINRSSDSIRQTPQRKAGRQAPCRGRHAAVRAQPMSKMSR